MSAAVCVANAEALAAIHRAAFADGWTAEALRSLMASEGVTALRAGEAFILVRAAAGEAEILTLAVAPSARRQGLARALVAAAKETVRRQGATRLCLEVSAQNAPARALYDSAGFRQVGARRGYYADGADALTLACDLA
jgi:ribosomal-protein-alanine N-acetyltransferase